MIINEDSYKYFNCDVITFCSLANKLGVDFDPDKCEEGNLVFTVPLKWLINTINSDIRFIPPGFNYKKINNISDFSKWLEAYTHTEGEYILEKAINDNILIGKPTIIHCDYCNSNSTY